MNKQSSVNEPRRIALLLADRAVQPLTAAEAQELEALLAAHPEIDEFELDEVAAVYQMAQPVLAESMPDTLRARVFADAQNYFFQAGSAAADAERIALEQSRAAQVVNATGSNVVPPLSIPREPQALRFGAPGEKGVDPNGVDTANAGAAQPDQTTNVLSFPRAERRSGWAGTLQWGGWLAAAACLTLAVNGWWQARQYRNQVASLLQQASPSLTEQRAKLLQQGADITQLDWAPSTYPGMQKVRGDVVWSNSAQKGFLRFTGMPVNDRQKLVYQLWVFDANQDERYPIDGGVFDITSNGEVLVPIQAKIKVVKPLLFAVTVEKTGGVVVSKRDKLALLAKAG